MDDRRMVVAGGELWKRLGILPLAEIVMGYAQYSEMELTMHALINNSGPEKCFGCFYTRPDVLNDSRVMCVGKSDLPNYYEHMSLDVHWSDQRMFSIAFLNPYYIEHEMHVSVKELVPSNGLKIKARDRDNYVLDIVRDKYLAKIREKMAEI